MNLRACGEAALLLETDDVLGWYAALAARLPPGVTDLVPAARTLLLRFDDTTDATALRYWLTDVEPLKPAGRRGEPVVIPVRYDGADLAEVARLTGLAEGEIVTVHTGPEYAVGFSGFAPGFGYLTGLDPRLRLPRRSTPRVRVPAGAVAVAGEFTGVYPRPSPGGWRLLGSTNATLWDPDRSTPALLRPGTTVRFVAVDELPAPPNRPLQSGPVPTGGVEVVHCGPLTTVQDSGRPGYAALGVGRSGAADTRSAALANRLVGNAPGAACLELTNGGGTLSFREPARVAVTGAPCPITGQAMNAPFQVAAGEVVTIGAPEVGLRTYVAVRGGIAVPPTLGSRATDVLSGVGPPVLRPGTVLPIGTDHDGPPPAIDVAPVNPPAGGDLVVHVLPGPRADWFTEAAMHTLLHEKYVVTSDSNRIGVRLAGPPLGRARAGELPSEGMVAGAVQVPPSGRPTVFLADHPVTGGYPVIAVVCAADLPVIAQARPGQAVSFRTRRPAAARSR